MPPVWASVHAAESQRMGRYSPTRSTTAPPMRPPAASGMVDPAAAPLWAIQSSSSSVNYRSVERPHTTGTALGSGSSLNSPYTYYYGTQPLNPAGRACQKRPHRETPRWAGTPRSLAGDRGGGAPHAGLPAGPRRC